MIDVEYMTDLALQTSDERAGRTFVMAAGDNWMCMRCTMPRGLPTTTPMSRHGVTNRKAMVTY